jgi:hypothetical protein
MTQPIKDFLVYIIELCAERFFNGNKSLAYNQLKNTNQISIRDTPSSGKDKTLFAFKYHSLDVIKIMCYTFIIMDKSINILTKTDSRNFGYVPGFMSERIALVWSLTCEVVSLSKKYDVEQRLQRHITRLIKQKGF